MKWEEIIAEAFEDVGIQATKEQIDAVSIWVESAYENQDLYTGGAPNPLLEEVKKLEHALKIERDKSICDLCGGSGWLTHDGIVRRSSTQCYKCRGEGFIR